MVNGRGSEYSKKKHTTILSVLSTSLSCTYQLPVCSLVMTMIMDGRSFKLPYAFLPLLVLVHLRLALGQFILVVGDANNISCPEGERQALLEFKNINISNFALYF